jgi:beta-galactosidase
MTPTPTGSPSNTATATLTATATPTATAAGPLPQAPSGLTANAEGGSNNPGIRVSWTNNSSVATNDVLIRSTDQENWTTIAILPANATSYVDGNVAPNTTYYYRVHAMNGAGSSADSNTASATTR